MALLDTSALIDLTRRPGSSSQTAIANLLARLTESGDSLFTSRINEAEFRVVTFLPSATKRTKADVENTLAQMGVLEFDQACAAAYAQLFAEMRFKGRPIGRADVLIAAVAVVNRQPIVTRNIRHFLAIPRVQVITY